MINDQLPGKWGAEMLSYEIGACAYSTGYMKAPSKIFPIKLVPTIGIRSIVMKFDFMGESPFETAMAIADMTDELQKGADILLPDGFYYWCEFDSASTPARKAPWIEHVKFTLHGVRHSRLEETTLTENGTVIADGNIETPMIVYLVPSGSSMIFQGITIDSSLPVTIDGIDTTIKDSDGYNIFGDTDMTKWPSLVPGENTITMTGVSSAKISYYPIWK